LNAVYPTRTITLTPCTEFDYCGVGVQDGRLCLHFHPNYLTSNVNDVAESFIDVISKALQPAGASSLSFPARASIKADYEV
jgi:hypothetical protein